VKAADHRDGNVGAGPAEVSRGRSTGGDHGAGKGRTPGERNPGQAGDDRGNRSHPANAGLLGSGEAVSSAEPLAERSDRLASADGRAQPVRAEGLWERMLSRQNLERALRQVERNKGAPGVDGMTVAELRPWLKTHWPVLRMLLDEGHHRPQPVRRVTIPKADGGERELGVPTALDRLIQQAIAQVLTPIFDPGFSKRSFGYRPGRSARQAVNAAREYVTDGYRWVVDVDLERFFDRVQHDVVMARVARRVGDRRLLRLIRRYLEAGVMVEGVKQPSAEGTPQGSPLSPLLSNIMLDDLDRELERRGHRFVRYADDVRVHVRSERAGKRTLAGLTEFIEKRLKLRVNRKKSSVRQATQATVLGFGFCNRPGGKVGIRIDPKALQRMRWRLRRLTGRSWRISMEERIRLVNRYITAWCAYFGLAETPSVFEEVDRWLRRRLRQVRWKEWKHPRTRWRNLRKLGIPDRQARQWAGSESGYWRMAGSAPLHRALPNSYWEALGLQTFSGHWRQLRFAW
jgi:RNA-directed DNA polymerase